MKVSVIVPTLDEERSIGSTLEALASVRGDIEVIVVDGGSRDSTVEIALSRRVTVWATPRGRGLQLHAGARKAQGEVLWFLHADTQPVPDAAERILEALRDPHVAGGSFALRFGGAGLPARFLTWFYPHLRKLGLCYGDSAIFVRRSAYETAGGFQPHPIFEDLDLVRRVKPIGRLVHLSTPVVTSARRFEGRSFALNFIRWTGLQLLYWLGVSPHALARLYPPIRNAGKVDGQSA